MEKQVCEVCNKIFYHDTKVVCQKCREGIDVDELIDGTDDEDDYDIVSPFEMKRLLTKTISEVTPNELNLILGAQKFKTMIEKQAYIIGVIDGYKMKYQKNKEILQLVGFNHET